MALLFLGKLLIAVGLCFQAFLLIDNSDVADAFNSRLTTVLASCNCIPLELQTHIRDHLRQIVAGLLCCSILAAFVNSRFLKCLVLLGLVTLMLVRYHHVKSLPSFTDHTFWQCLTVIGGMIYLLGAESHEKPRKKQEKTNKQ